MPNPFLIGLSGLTANNQGIALVGNNLANSNTVAFKNSNLFLNELVFAGGEISIGQGVIPSNTQQVWSQGNIQQSQLNTDLAIQGPGFFVVGDGQGSQFYSRAGNFLINNEGKLMRPDGLFLLGYPADANGTIDTVSALVPMDVNPGKIVPPVVTTEVRFKVNLDSQTATGDKFATSSLVFDSLGDSHSVVLEFTKTAPGWNYSMTIAPEEVGGNVGDPAVVIKAGTVVFSNAGIMTTPAADVTGIAITGFTNGAADLTFDWDLFSAAGEGFITGYTLPSATSETFQDGNSAGVLTSFIVRSDGVVEGLFSNSKSQAVGQVVMANFSNLQGLTKVSTNLLGQSLQSGLASVGSAGTGGRGLIRGNSLENSNVDIAEEFIKLILFQRGYQASSRVILTADEVTQEAINLKR